jgi:hypothetical protein
LVLKYGSKYLVLSDHVGYSTTKPRWFDLPIKQHINGNAARYLALLRPDTFLLG